MVVVLAAAVAELAQGNRDNSCRTHEAATCIKVDQWANKGGAYFNQYPYGVAGGDDANAPWVQISRAEYVAEVGTRLRSAAGFGVLALGLASFLSVAEEGMYVTRRPRDGEITFRDELEQSR